MKILVSPVIFLSFIALSRSADFRYDRYSGNATIPEFSSGDNNIYSNCTILVRHCTPHEGSRIDGTCNNYHFPTRGSARGPYLRLLSPDYANDRRDIRRDRNGGELPSARRVRTTLHSDGRVVDNHEFTIAAYHFLEFIHLDVSLLNGPYDYLRYRTYCCQPEGRLDPRCKPIGVPNDDPYLRVTDIRCLNFSRAETFQDDGCINDTYTPEQINFQTPVIDLSTIYGVDERGENAVRLYQHGLLKLEYRDNRYVPIANVTAIDTSDLNSLTSLMDPAVLANLTMLNQQMSNSSMWQNMTMQSRQNMLFNFMMLNGPIFNNSQMWQNSTLNKGMLGNMFNLQNMQGVLSMLQNLTMLNSQMLNNLAVLNPERLGNLTWTNQQMLENLSRLNPQMLANLIMLNPQLFGNLGSFGNPPVTSRRRRQVDPISQVVVPISLPNTGGLVDAISSPVAEALDEYIPTLMRLINMTNLNNSICLQNMNNETRCYAFGLPEAGNVDLRTTTIAIFFMRNHNHLAMALRELNPCWLDDRLFKVARQINIATAQNILMYELLPKILGYKNMLKYGLISEHVHYVRAYDEQAVPLVYAEFEIAVRYYHSMLDGRIKLYDEKYHYDREFSVSNTTFRQSLIEQDKNFEKINRGTFYQHAARIDDIEDPEISEKYYGDLQRAADLPSLDIQRGRDLGIRGYNDYRHICGMKPAKKWEDFDDVMDHERIDALKRLYVQIEDIDLLAGIMSENHMPHTSVGPTLFCIMTKQLQLYRYADRFWFERGHQFHSLALPQLHEIRKTNMARFACDNAEAIKFIQPHAFEIVEPHNQHEPCTHIPGLDIHKWKDNSCNNDKHDYSTNEDSKLGIINRNNLINNKGQNPFDNLPFPKEIKTNAGDAWPIDGKNDAKNEHLMQWSMNLHNNEKHNEPFHRTLYQDDGKQKEEMTLFVRKPGPYSDHWTINKYGKFEGAVYGPTKKHEDPDLLALKHSMGIENPGQHLGNVHHMGNENLGQHLGNVHHMGNENPAQHLGNVHHMGIENHVQHLDNIHHMGVENHGRHLGNIEDDGKYNDDTDWPVKNKHHSLKPRAGHQNEFKYLTLKHSMDDNNRNYGEKSIDDSKHKVENNRYTMQPGVKYNNNIDKLIKNNNNEIRGLINKHQEQVLPHSQNGHLLSSTSHQGYQPDFTGPLPYVPGF